MNANYPTAQALRKEIDSKKSAVRERQVKTQLENTFRRILDSKHRGSVNVQTVMPEVHAELVRLGYQIKQHKACSMGDIDSITISW